MKELTFLLRSHLNPDDLKHYLKQTPLITLYENLPLLLKSLSFHDLTSICSKSINVFIKHIKSIKSKNNHIFEQLYYILQTSELQLNSVLIRKITLMLDKKFKRKEYTNTLNFLNCYYLSSHSAKFQKLNLPLIKYSTLSFTRHNIIQKYIPTSLNILKEFDSANKPLLISANYKPIVPSNPSKQKVLAFFKQKPLLTVKSPISLKFILKRSEAANFETSIFILFDWLNYIFSLQKRFYTPKIVTYKTFFIPNDLLILEYLPNIKKFDEIKPETIWGLPPSQQREFFETGLGAYLAIYTLLLYDRHYENILITEDFRVLNIDFGFQFGEKNFIDTGKLPIDRSFRIAISENWENFKVNFVRSVEYLKDNFAGISRIIEILFYGSMDYKKWIEKIKKRLFVGVKFDEKKILDMLENAVTDRKTRIKNFFHKVGKNVKL